MHNGDEEEWKDGKAYDPPPISLLGVELAFVVELKQWGNQPGKDWPLRGHTHCG